MANCNNKGGSGSVSCNYDPKTFVSIPAPSDPLEPALKIYNKAGKLKMTIDPWISTFTQKNRYIYIIVNNNIVYQNTLDFCSDANAAAGLAKLNEIKKIYMTRGQCDRDYYTKQESDNRYYTKNQVDEKLDDYFTQEELTNNTTNLHLSGLTIQDIDVYEALKNINSGLTNNVTYNGDSEITIGGINSGDVFSATTMQDMWYTLLHPYQPPIVNLSSNLPGTVGLGEVLNGNYTFTWTTTNVTNIVSGLTLSGPQINVSGLTNSGGNTTETISGLTSITPTTNTWTIQGLNTEGDNFSDNVTMNWSHTRYCGTNANTTLNNTEILALSVEYSASRLKTWTQDGNGAYIYYCYPVSFGDNDPNPPFLVGNLPNSSWQRTTQTVTLPGGVNVDYYIYRTLTIQNGTGISIQKL
jgi:hypothetical protein